MVRKLFKQIAITFAETAIGKRLVITALAETGLGQKLVVSALRKHPQIALEIIEDPLKEMESFSRKFREDAIFPNAKFPSSIDGFEDLTSLFTNNFLNRGIISQDIDEAAYIFRLVRSLKSLNALEIGRYRGGSTFLISAAMDNDSHLLSIDNWTKLELKEMGIQRDNELLKALEGSGLKERVELVVADSATFSFDSYFFDFVFLDGDHTYEGVSKDYNNVRYRIKPGGHLLFHDGVQSRPLATCEPGVAKLVKEIEKDPYFMKEGEVGSIVHFVRTDVPFA